MPTPGAIEQLEHLDHTLQDTLTPLPTLQRILQQRVHNQFPRLPDTLKPSDLYTGTQSLPQCIDQYWQGTAELLDTAPWHYEAEGSQHPLSPEYGRLLHRFVRLFCTETKTLYLDNLKRFWRAIALQLREIRMAQLQAESTLRQQDETLPSAAHALLTRVLDHPDARQRQALAPRLRPGVYRLSLIKDSREAPLPGCFVVTQRDARGFFDNAGAFQVPPPLATQVVSEQADAGMAVLYTLAHGVEAFDSLAAAHLELAERLDDYRQGQALLGMLADSDRAAMDSPDELRLTEVHEDLFHHGVSALEQRQRSNVLHAWPIAPASLSLASLDNTLTPAAEVLPLIERHASLRTRYGALLEKHMPAWLKNASQDSKVLIVQAMQALALATAKAAAPALPSVHSFGQQSSLQAYAKRQLARELALKLGRTVDPDSVFISTTTAYQTGPLTPPTNPVSSVPGRLRTQAGNLVTLQTHRRTLTQLALENVDHLDSDYLLTAKVQDLAGQPLADLTPAYLKTLVRMLNVGGTYLQHIRHRLVDSAEGAWRREVHGQLTLARLRAEALKAHHAGHLSPDRRQRSYQWIKCVLDHPTPHARPPVDGHRIQVQTLLLHNSPLTGLLVLSPEAATSVPAVVVYTPDAPDRRPWRDFPNRAAMLAAFSHQPDLRSYLLSRASLGARDDIQRLLDSGHPGAFSRLQVISTDFLQHTYLAEVDRVMTDSDNLSTTTREADLEAVWNGTLTLLEVIALVLPTRAQIALALGRAMLSLWNGTQSLAKDDRQEGLRHLLAMLTYLGDASISYAGSPFFSRTFRHLPITPPTPVNPNFAVNQELTNLRYRIDSLYSEGVYEQRSSDGGPSRYFIEDNSGRRYQIDFDGEHWHVVDNRNPDAYYKSLVRKNADGEWEMPQDIRWDGQLPDLNELKRHARLEDSDAPTGQADTQGLIRQGDELFLRLGRDVFRLKRSLRDHRYVLRLPAHQRKLVNAALHLRRNLTDDGWEIRVKQAGIASHWLAFS